MLRLWPVGLIYLLSARGLLAFAAAEEPPKPAPDSAAAPTPTPTPMPAPVPVPVPEDEIAAPPAPEPLRPGDIQIRADQQSREGGHYKARGFVDLQAGDIRIQSDALDLYESTDQQGVTNRRLEAEGNVVFMRGDERLAGDRLVLDMSTNRGTFENAIGYFEPGVFIEGDRIERLDANTYRIEGARFTSCAQPSPRWSFSASSATLKLHDKIQATNVLFKVKKVPAFYFPYFLYPIRDDQRSSGILFPHFGYSSTRGFNIGTGLFWAMGRSADQTLYADYFSRFGEGLGHELRYRGSGTSLGAFRTYLFKLTPELQETSGQEWDYDVDWAAVQELPGRVRATVNARLYSDIEFQQQIQDSFNMASTRSQRAVVNLRRSFGSTRVELMADTNETTFTGSDTTRVNRHLPSLSVRRTARKLGRTGIVFAYEASLDRLARGDQDLVEQYSRFDLAPTLSRPFATSFLQVTPRLSLRYSRWGASLDDEEDGAITGPGLDRRFLETSVQMTGPDFSRVFHNLGFYSDKIKHVFGPEVTWSYRTRVDDFDLIPKFDGEDYYLGTNQVRYALVNRLLAKRPGRGGKERTVEFFNWRVEQTYYVQISEGQNNYDPNYSASAFGPGGVPSHYSPVRSRMRFRPGEGLNLNFDTEYDVNYDQIRNLGLGGGLNLGSVRLLANWSRRLRVTEVAEQRVPTSDYLRGGLSLTPFEGLRFEGSADYDLLRKNLQRLSGRLRLGVQCCAFMTEVIQYDYNQRIERQIRFSIELANIGTFGNFMAEEGPRASRGSF
jgi:LPS-assembly protein